MMVCRTAGASVTLVRLAVFALMIPLPSNLVPSKKLTDPVMENVAPLGTLTGDSVAVRVSGTPAVSVAGVALNAVTVAPLESDTVRAGEVAAV